jgi:hypothetical protein
MKKRYFLIKHFLLSSSLIVYYLKIDILYDDKSLNDDLVLIDVAYLFAWIPRNEPMKFKYRFIASAKQEDKLKQIENKINMKQESIKQTHSKPQIDIKQSLVQQTKCI